MVRSYGSTEKREGRTGAPATRNEGIVYPKAAGKKEHFVAGTSAQRVAAGKTACLAGLLPVIVPCPDRASRATPVSPGGTL